MSNKEFEHGNAQAVFALPVKADDPVVVVAEVNIAQ